MTEKLFYDNQDVQQIINCSQSKAYDIIRQLRKSFSKEYPNSITIQGKIAKWYFEEKVLCNSKKENEG